jgi:hypothetical protein
MLAYILLRAAGDLALALVTQASVRLVQGQPESTLDFNPHFGRNVVDAAGFITQ